MAKELLSISTDFYLKDRKCIKCGGIGASTKFELGGHEWYERPLDSKNE